MMRSNRGVIPELFCKSGQVNDEFSVNFGGESTAQPCLADA